MKISSNWWRMAEVYKIFANGFEDLDFSHDSAEKMFYSETYGGIHKFPYYLKTNGKYNGFSVGKHWMDVTITSWLEDIESGNLTKRELLSDKQFEHVIPWLLKILNLTEDDYRWFIETQEILNN